MSETTQEDKGQEAAEVPVVEEVGGAAANAERGAEAAPSPSEAEGPASGSEGTADAPASPAGGAKAPDKPQPADWRDRRIAKLTAQLREAQASARADATVQVEAESPGLSEAEIERRVSTRAMEIAQRREFNRQCDAIANQGQEAFGKDQFTSRVAALVRLVDVNDPADRARYDRFLNGAIETGEAARLIYELGADPNEADRIMNLPPGRMEVALAKMALAKPSNEPSRAPNPIRPVGSRGSAHEAIDPDDPDRADRLGTAEWMRRREAKIAAASGRA